MVSAESGETFWRPQYNLFHNSQKGKKSRSQAKERLTVSLGQHTMTKVMPCFQELAPQKREINPPVREWYHHHRDKNASDRKGRPAGSPWKE